MRQAHSEARPSDLFFICKLSLKDPHQTPVLQEEEISALTWMSPEDYANQDLWKGSPVYQEMNNAAIRAARHESTGLQEVKMAVGFRPGENTIYTVNDTNE